MKTAEIFKDVIFNKEKPMVQLLLETDFTKEIRIAMQKGTAMKEHKTKFPIVVETVEGNIDFGVKGEVFNLIKGNLIALDGDVPHDLKANENSIIRLTLSKYDSSKRVEKLVE